MLQNANWIHKTLVK